MDPAAAAGRKPPTLGLMAPATSEKQLKRLGARGSTKVQAPAIDTGALDFTAAEAKQLRWFLDGAIMNVDTRQHLWRSWGLCSRHAWGYAVAECELRGGRPFSTSILYEDLTRRSGELVGRHMLPWPRVLARLQRRDSCFTCDFLAVLQDDAQITGRAEWTLAAERMNRRARVGLLVAETETQWRARACPLCLGGEGLVCRPHLLAGAEPPGRLADELRSLADRLRALKNSMTVRRTPVGPLERVAWIEALGWFGAWDYPAKLGASLLRASGPTDG
jgi:hypothetical protein